MLRLRAASLRPLGVTWSAGARAMHSMPYSAITIGVPKETAPREKRVAQTPESVAKLVKEGFAVKVEAGAGAGADFSDAAYTAAGAVVSSRDDVWKATLVTKVLAPSPEEAKLLGDRMILSLLCAAESRRKMRHARHAQAGRGGAVRPRTSQPSEALPSLLPFLPCFRRRASGAPVAASPRLPTRGGREG